MWRKKVNQKLLHVPKIVYLSYTSNVIRVSSPYQNNWKRKRVYSVPPLKLTRFFGSNFTRWNLSFKIISERYLKKATPTPSKGISDPIKGNLYNYLSTLTSIFFNDSMLRCEEDHESISCAFAEFRVGAFVRHNFPSLVTESHINPFRKSENP